MNDCELIQAATSNSGATSNDDDECISDISAVSNDNFDY